VSGNYRREKLSKKEKKRIRFFVHEYETTNSEEDVGKKELGSRKKRSVFEK
jgi:hypothetical protein